MPSEEHQQVVELIRSMAERAPAEESLEASRERLDSSDVIFPVPPDVGITPFDLDGIACERHHPPGAGTSRLLVYLHGGSDTAGSPRSPPAPGGRLAPGGGGG